MNPAGIRIIETIAAFALVVGLAIFLKRGSIIRKEDAPLFARLVTTVVLPAVIFSQFLRRPPADPLRLTIP